MDINTAAFVFEIESKVIRNEEYMSKIISFQDAIKSSISNDKKPTLLLGNGFSISLFPDIFTYQNLFEQAKSSDLFKSESTLQLFLRKKTFDFECIIRLISNTNFTLQSYNTEDVLIEKLKSDYIQLKNILAEVIAKNHPDMPSEISDEQYKNCCNFLINFGSVYTLNYDLLLYWVVMRNLTKIKFQDGFDDPHSGESPENYTKEDYVNWQVGSTNKIDLYFLHGALHLYDAKYELRKFSFSRTGIKLKDQIL